MEQHSSGPSPLARKFLDVFSGEFPALARGSVEYPQILRIPAAHPDVGDLIVRDDEEELTIELGGHHHQHHSLYMYSDLPPTEAEDHVVEEVLDFVRDLLANRIVLGLNWDGHKLSWSSTYRIDSGGSAGHRSVGYREYFWTGPRAAG